MRLMSPGERPEAEARADRLIRRGEMAEAVGILRGLVQAFPDDEALSRRLADLAEALQPSELTHPKAQVGSVDRSNSGTPEQEGERLFAQGDYAGAITAYRRALQLRPDNELVRERLEELFTLAQTRPPQRPGTADLLKGLLERVAARRRV